MNPRTKMIKCWFDGGCAPTNPGGQMAYAVIISNHENRIIYKFSKIIPASSSNSNNLAEYLGFKEILFTLLHTNLQDNPTTVFGDSQLVINQMFSNWKIKDGSYVNAALECKKLIKKFSNISGKWIPKHENNICHGLIFQKFKDSGIKYVY